MRKLSFIGCVLVLLALTAPFASADDIALNDWIVNVDGIISSPFDNPLPTNFNDAAFDFSTGLGTLTATFNAAGSHNVIVYFDHDITGFNNPWNNEEGHLLGSTSPAGFSYSLNVPGIVAPLALSGALDNFNGVATGAINPDDPYNSLNDVSMALGWNFVLASGETAVLHFNLSVSDPGIGRHYLAQNDLATGDQIFYSSDLTIRGGGGPTVPEPGTFLLLGTGLAVASLARFRKRG